MVCDDVRGSMLVLSIQGALSHLLLFVFTSIPEQAVPFLIELHFVQFSFLDVKHDVNNVLRFQSLAQRDSVDSTMHKRASACEAEPVNVALCPREQVCQLA
eukprot:TRINITY_DN31636_c0_g1_i1.p2 TRINITY_DN31636_c0_g1~~TRINITY_DN31636_c0_g1_i1.p2  ORF type:complete len:101 (-),score=4.07 TRINITY_DN31636_c0_g1_i1:129-431(-)